MESGAVEYDPPGVIAAKESWIGAASEMNFISKFLLDYEITGNEEDFIKSSDINEWIVQQDLGKTVQKHVFVCLPALFVAQKVRTLKIHCFVCLCLFTGYSCCVCVK